MNELTRPAKLRHDTTSFSRGLSMKLAGAAPSDIRSRTIFLQIYQKNYVFSRKNKTTETFICRELNSRQQSTLLPPTFSKVANLKDCFSEFKLT